MKNIISSITIFYPFLKRIFMKKLKFLNSFLFSYCISINIKKMMKYDKKKKDRSDIIFFIF